MKRKSREVNVFSMSMLDLFASAMGAFMLITLVLLPFFPNTGDSRVRVAEVQEKLAQAEQEFADTREQLAQAEQKFADAREKLAQAEQELADAREQLAQCENESRPSRQQHEELQNQLESCRKQLKKKFVLVVMSWPGVGDDIDLHVVDPQGREYSYLTRRFAGSEAALEEDNTRGPGNEIWLHPQAGPGRYKVFYHYYSKPRNSNGTTVRGLVIHAQGKHQFNTVQLRRKGEKPLVAIINVSDQGDVTVQNVL